ncbi:hypothetical protein PVAP13_5KG489700 [Panicum virgatum]|uniref:Vesicle transport v-SNARE N-terminal domain-containing protein n=1 Tax=Panicum virgatum TaxID=38727 RepID=A0A8T0SNH3_PANVG|nr:hypothetical protein PVAP13_5KG489700 [Panicum virgatum]
MSEVFEGYERQYCEASASLSRKCTAASALDGEKKKQKLSEIQSGVEEAESLIRKMDLEARSLQPSVKAGFLAKLREYKSDLNNVKSELKRISAPNARQATREELLEAGMADTLAVSTDQRGRLMMTTERLNQSTDRIKESRRTINVKEDGQEQVDHWGNHLDSGSGHPHHTLLQACSLSLLPGRLARISLSSNCVLRLV